MLIKDEVFTLIKSSRVYVTIGSSSISPEPQKYHHLHPRVTQLIDPVKLKGIASRHLPNWVPGARNTSTAAAGE